MDESWTRRLLRCKLWVLFRLFFRIEFIGRENIPSRGPCIITPNHKTYFDPFFVALAVKPYTRYMAWDRLFQIPILGGFIRSLGAFPVNIRHPDKSSYKRSLEILKEGGFLMVFPEGGRGEPGIVGEFKPGAARLALATGATLLPCTVIGGDRVWPPGQFVPRPGKIRVIYHPPIPVDSMIFTNPEEERDRVTQILSRLRNLVVQPLQENPPRKTEKVP